jgi:hypothetical protein
MAEANGRGQIGVFDAAFLGVGAMVGAGIFALLGEAGVIPRLFLSPARRHQPRVDDPSGHYDFGPM